MRFHAADRPLGGFFSFVAVSAATLFAALAATVAEAHPLSTGVTGTVSPPAASSIIVPVKSFKCRLVDGWPECGWFGNKAKHESSDDEDRPRKHKKKSSGSDASSDDGGDDNGASKSKKKNAGNDDSTGKKADDGGTGNKKNL